MDPHQLRDIERHVMAFNGDLYGEYVRESRIEMKKNITSISFRIDPMFLTPFINTMSLKYPISSVESCTRWYVHQYKIGGITANILPLKKFDFRATSCMFDCNILALNSDSMYVWKVVPCMRHMVDKISWILDRIRSKRFCLMTKSFMEDSTCKIIETAVSLVGDGWIMDNEILGAKEGWVVNHWRNMPLERKQKCTECAICHEEIAADDIAINTCCNHNFHWNCKSAASLGLKQWVHIGGRTSCPTCRTNIFGAPNNDNFLNAI